jgi:hypothetical protein
MRHPELTVVVMGCGERCKLLLRNVTICLPLKHHHRREHRTIPRDGHRHCRPLCVVSRRADVDGLLSDELKRALGVHQKIDGCLVHV